MTKLHLAVINDQMRLVTDEGDVIENVTYICAQSITQDKCTMFSASFIIVPDKTKEN